MDFEQINTDPRQEIIELLQSEMNGIKRKMTEIKGQTDQQKILVDREQQRNVDVVSELQNIHNNLDTVPRQDIRDKYEEALGIRSRLGSMRGQLEKLQASYEQLEKDQRLLSDILGKIQGVDILDEMGDEENGARTSMNIVRIVQAQEDERQRLARQMHDGPAQSLTNFILQAEICQRLFDRNPQRAGEELNNLKTAASVTFQKVRDFIFDLRPMMLDDLGVVPTVRRYVGSFKEKNDIEVELEIIGEDRRLESHREVMVFRAIQELMGHARDFANAGKIRVRLDMSSDRIRGVVEDDGRGFDVDLSYSPEEAHGSDPRQQSLITLKEKYELVEGSVVFDSSEAQGTTVRIELPAGAPR